MTPLLVLADDYKLALQYAQINQLGPEAGGRWRLVRHPDQVRNIDGPGRFVIVTGRKPIPAIARQQRGDTIAHLKRAGYRRIDP
jgi:hypothetical protein